LVLPLLWYSVPAQLKDWIDRVFLSGAFYGGRRIYERAGMAGKPALVLASLVGREHMFGPDALHGELTGMLRHLLQRTPGNVGYDVHEPFFAYRVPYVDDAARGRMLQRLEREVEAVDERPVLAMPGLDAFDAQFRPLAPAR